MIQSERDKQSIADRTTAAITTPYPTAARPLPQVPRQKQLGRFPVVGFCGLKNFPIALTSGAKKIR